jgi:hypothetical protein
MSDSIVWVDYFIAKLLVFPMAAGDLELLQRALQHSSTDALAALQANTYRLPSALATEQAWNSALQHVGSMVAAHTTSSYAYYGVTQSVL